MTFNIKQNDTSPSASYTLTDGSGAVDLTGASVRFHMASGNTVVIDAAATIVSAAAGTVRYDWDAVDTASSGVFRAEFEVTYADASVETFPNDSFLTISITPDIA